MTEQTARPRKVIVNVASSLRVGECFSCKAPVRWGKTDAGRVCPADAEPIEGHYYSHFETCPNASKHKSLSGATDKKLQADLLRLNRWNKGR